MKLIDFIKSRDYDILPRWIDKDTLAEIDYLNMVIRINLELILTQIVAHEFLHDCYPDLAEGKILKKTIRYLNRMKVPEIKAVGRETFRQIIFREVKK